MFSNPFHKKDEPHDKDDGPIDIDDLVAKLEAAEGQIRGLISGAVPKVDVVLPRLAASAFDSVGAPAPRGFEAVPQGLPQEMEMVPGRGAASGSGSASQVLLGNVAPAMEDPTAKEAGEVVAKAEGAAADAADRAASAAADAADRAASAAADVEAGLDAESARLQAAAASEAASRRAQLEALGRSLLRRAEAQRQVALAKVEEFRAPITAALTSLVLVVGAAVAGFGPAVAIIASVVSTTAGFAATLHARAHGIRSVLLTQLDNAVQKVLDCIGKAKALLLGLSADVLRAIDNMCEEQKAALDKAKELEDTLKVDIPDPSDMKRPLEACKDRLLDVAKQIEEQVPENVRALLNTMTIGKVINDERQFNFLVIMLPTAAVFLLNATFAAAQFAFHCQHCVSEAQGLTVDGAMTSRRLRGTGPVHNLEQQAAGIPWADYLHPWLAQVALMALQVVLAMAISSAPRLIPYANDAIGQVEVSASEKINSRIQGAVDAILKNVFDEVKDKCDDFFPRFKDVLEKVKDAQEMAEKAGALAGAAKNLRNMF